jgi:hypothetical protein
MLVYRTIYGVVRDAQGNLAKLKPVFFEPVGPFGSAGDIVSKKAIKCITDANGSFSCQILTTDADGGFVRYEFTFPNGSRFQFDLMPGSPISIDELLNLSVAAGNSTQAAIENVIQQALEGLAPDFLHTQNSPASEWIVNHNLGVKPNAAVLDTGGNVVDAQVLHISANQLRVYFSSAQTGAVRCI